MTKSWDEGDISVQSRTTSNPRQHYLGDRRIEVPQEHDEAGKEEEDGEVQHDGQRLKHPRKDKVLNPIGVKSMVTSSPGFTGSETWASDLEVFSCPLLYQICEDSTCQAHDQAQEPKRIDPDARRRWSERRWGRREGNIPVSKRRLDVCEVEVGGVEWVRLNVLN